MSSAQFTRILKLQDPRMVGIDIEGVGRALCRGGFFMPLGDYVKTPEGERRMWGEGKDDAVRKLQKSAGLKVDGVYDRPEHNYLNKTDAFDALATWQMLQYRPPLSICYPFPEDSGGNVCQGLHQTAGIPGNWAIDFCHPPGVGVFAVEKGWIARLSGHDPNDDTWDSQGVFGWSVYFETRDGYRYFVTHLGWRPPELKPGLPVDVGDLIGKVGDQHFRPDHVHYGVSSTMGQTAAKKRITEVSKAPRIH